MDKLPHPTFFLSPMQNRPKGRWFLGVLLLLLCGIIGYTVWDSFFRYQAHGIVVGRIIHIYPPHGEWEVYFTHAREGDFVSQNQLLYTLDSAVLREELRLHQNEIILTQSVIQADVAKLKIDSAVNKDRGHEAIAFYYSEHANLLKEKAKLSEMDAGLKRAEKLFASKVMSKEEYDGYYYGLMGQKDKVSRLEIEVKELEKRVQAVGELTEKGDDKFWYLDFLKPNLSKLEVHHDKIKNNQEKLKKGEVKSPVSGTVLKMNRFTGERCNNFDKEKPDCLVKMLEQDSLEIVLYLPQKLVDKYQVGDYLRLILEPKYEKITAEVVRIGTHQEESPEQIKYYYRAGEKLLPVYLKPDRETSQLMSFRVGCTVKMPNFGF